MYTLGKERHNQAGLAQTGVAGWGQEGEMISVMKGFKISVMEEE